MIKQVVYLLLVAASVLGLVMLFTYKINCVPCHGEKGKGDGVIGTFFKFKPADLTSFDVQQNSDGALFLVVSNGVEGRMPPLNENFNVRERWDVVNFIHTLKQESPAP